LPTEFLLFRAGANETSKGTFVLTPESAAACMAAYQREGVELIVDLEHDSLSTEARNMRSDAGDARAWFKLELRADGSLWAVDVRWTPDGERRLREKTQRYISPAFEHDEKGVVMQIANAAMCSMPATYNAPALVAASRRSTGAPSVACQALIYSLIELAKKSRHISKKVSSR